MKGICTLYRKLMGCAMQGDVLLPHCGVSTTMRGRLRKQVNYVIHCAASIIFNEHVHTLLASNYEVGLLALCFHPDLLHSMYVSWERCTDLVHAALTHCKRRRGQHDIVCSPTYRIQSLYDIMQYSKGLLYVKMPVSATQSVLVLAKDTTSRLGSTWKHAAAQRRTEWLTRDQSVQATRNIADETRSFKRLRGFVHLSTAFVNCNQPRGRHVEERLYRFHADRDAAGHADGGADEDSEHYSSSSCSGSCASELEAVEALAQELAALPEAAASQRVSYSPSMCIYWHFHSDSMQQRLVADKNADKKGE